MRRRKKHTVSAANPWSWWWDLATQTTEMMTASAEVVTRRSIQASAMSNPASAADQRELATMVNEKIVAGQRSVAAMTTTANSAYRSISQFWMNQWMAGAGLSSRRTPSPAETMADAAQTTAKILKAGMQPYRQRAMSNAKRLRKRGPKR